MCTKSMTKDLTDLGEIHNIIQILRIKSVLPTRPTFTARNTEKTKEKVSS